MIRAAVVTLAVLALLGAWRGRPHASPPAGPVAEPLRDRLAQLTLRVERDPRDDLALRERASAWMRLARATGDHALYAKAEADLRRALELAPGNNAESKALLAAALAARHDFREAKRLASEAMEESPAAWIAGIRGDAELELGEHAAARADFERYAERDPGVASWARLARLEEVTGRPEKARGLLERCLEASREPAEQAWLRARLSGLLLASGDREGARREAREALRLAPGHPFAVAALTASAP